MGAVSKEWLVASIAAQANASSGWVTIPDGTTRIDVKVYGTDGKNFKLEINYKTTGAPSVVWTNTSVSASAKRFEIEASFDAPFAAGAQFQITGTNLHATVAATGIRAMVTYNEPDTW
jgi:hypothetical protein